MFYCIIIYDRLTKDDHDATISYALETKTSLAMNTRSYTPNPMMLSLPCYSKLLCFAGFGQVSFRLPDVAHGVYYRTSHGVPYPKSDFLTVVDCCFNSNLQSRDDSQTSFYALPIQVLSPNLFVYCRVFC